VNLRGDEQAALSELRDWVRGRFGERVRQLALFGSRARGEGDEDSDVDVLVVIDQLTSDEARAIGYFAGDLLTRHDVLVSPMCLSTERLDHLRRRERRIAREIGRDGIPL
jgi:uncharacterized protein